MRAVTGSHGRLDVLVNNAGIVGGGTLGTFTRATIEPQLATNLVAPILLPQAALPALEAGGGVVVNVTTSVGQRAWPGNGVYAATKTALELAPRGIRVVAVAPGAVDTPIGELARRTGATPRALRHYEEAGLITSRREHNGYRSYDEGAVVRVRNIRHLLDAGLTLDEVRAFLPCLDGDVASASPSPAGIRIALDRLAVLDERIAAQVEARDRLAAALRRVTDGTIARLA